MINKYKEHWMPPGDNNNKGKHDFSTMDNSMEGEDSMKITKTIKGVNNLTPYQDLEPSKTWKGEKHR
ncbi:Hypp9465 [Branchiostoma lanceolatum]|uniref:Hypp9465 protein n=1 Tax=Branchiostoma lanceolatum TaxID=7740 RepID=A0A8S4MNH6_BRALA|nr:Hypp9465 [Branchiostoma lanceolatum]